MISRSNKDKDRDRDKEKKIGKSRYNDKGD